jgi:molybdopterin-guanine dinucleotide biosynthesis protein MobB
MVSAQIPLLGFAAFSGTGKTTLLVQLIPLLRKQGIRIGMIKHAHHNFDVDKPGKDSYELRKAGASQMLITSSMRWALMTEKETEQDPLLSEMISKLDQEQLDIILVEGFKHEYFPKIELYRQELGKPLLLPEDNSIIALATDATINTEVNVPLLDINNPQQIADFIIKHFSLQQG